MSIPFFAFTSILNITYNVNKIVLDNFEKISSYFKGDKSIVYSIGLNAKRKTVNVIKVNN